jgi:positive control factor
MLRTLLYEYKKSLREVRKAYRAAETISNDDERETEKKIISGMISDLEYAIDWIEHGREPGKMRGADITKVYLKDPFTIDASLKYKPMVTEEPSRDLTLAEKEMLEDALCKLSKRESEVYILYFAEGCSLRKIADLLGVERSTVQTHYERAIKKIEKRKNESLFCMIG